VIEGVKRIRARACRRPLWMRWQNSRLLAALFRIAGDAVPSRSPHFGRARSGHRPNNSSGEYVGCAESRRDAVQPGVHGRVEGLAGPRSADRRAFHA